MKTYIAFNIGPIVDTFMMVRKPRHLWSASYLFSHLMGIIVKQATKEMSLISPAIVDEVEAADILKGIGAYPDRAFFQTTVESKCDISKIIEDSYSILYTDLTKEQKEENKITLDELKGYINIMGVELEADTEPEAVKRLNEELDSLELMVGPQPDNIDKLLSIIRPKDGKSNRTPLYRLGFGEKEEYNIPDIETIAKAGYVKGAKMLSHHRYFCVVQADGDKMGAVIKNLQEGKLQEISKEMIRYGMNACKIIRDAGGLPIYSGGDDLLFIAPVITKNGGNIFDLIRKIDEQYAGVSQKACEYQQGQEVVKTSMSYGIAISYYRHPLYECLAAARNQLSGVAKRHNNGAKNTIAVELHKHSGSKLNTVISKSDIAYCDIFYSLCKLTQKDALVSAVAHKLRANSDVYMTIGNVDDRLDAFFDKFMAIDEKDGPESKEYIRDVKAILKILLTNHIDKSYIEKEMYSTLRLAKFISGEEVKDE